MKAGQTLCRFTYRSRAAMMTAVRPEAARAGVIPVSADKLAGDESGPDSAGNTGEALTTRNVDWIGVGANG